MLRFFCLQHVAVSFWCDSVGIDWCILLVTQRVSSICGLMSFFSSGKLYPVIFLFIDSCSFSLFFPSGTPIRHIFQLTWRLISYLSSYLQYLCTKPCNFLKPVLSFLSYLLTQLWSFKFLYFLFFIFHIFICRGFILFTFSCSFFNSYLSHLFKHSYFISCSYTVSSSRAANPPVYSAALFRVDPSFWRL